MLTFRIFAVCHLETWVSSEFGEVADHHYFSSHPTHILSYKCLTILYHLETL